MKQAVQTDLLVCTTCNKETNKIKIYAEQYGFSRAFKEGDRNVYTSKYHTSFGRSWNPWFSAPYINKYSSGDRGIVDTNITNQEIIDWRDWKVFEGAK